MKAIVCTRYGSPDLLKLEDVEKPEPRDDQILVKVQGASVNPQDWHMMRGTPVLVRMESGLFRPRFRLLGTDISGHVEAVGPDATQFKPGDKVFGCLSEARIGAFAEYACESETMLAPLPANASFEDAAAVPGAGLTALQSLRDHGKIQSGQRVLVNGASGGVGTFAVQIAKALGAEVDGVCSTRNLDLVRSIGATRVFDYTREDFTTADARYDLIIDAVGNRSVSDYERVLVPGGRCVIVGFSSIRRIVHYMLAGPRISKRTGKHIGHMGSAAPSGKDIDSLKELIEAGKVKPMIDRRYPLGEVPDAIRYLEEGHARGKVVIGVQEG